MRTNKLIIATAILMLGLLVVPVFFTSTFILHMFTLVFFYIALTAAWNIPAFGGKFSLGHAAFFGLGGYTAAILYVKCGISPYIGMFAGTFVAMLGGVILSFPLVRLKGPFFTLASIAFAEVLRMVAVDWRSLTNGSVGINIPFKPGWLNLTFTSGMPFYYIAMGLAIAVILLSWWIRSSSLGYHLRAAAADEDAAKALGINTAKSHFLGLMWSSGLTGLIGVLYVFYNYVLEPGSGFSMDRFSLQPAMNGIIGGMGTIWGPVIGAIIMTPLGEFLRFYLGTIQQGLNFVVYGLMLIAVVNFVPGGIVSLMEPWFKKKKSGDSSAADN
ncbi:MAG: branched-chain amino acid ABC transporter permease [Desulfarculaceae bacterium]|nr:branched-chain amino acid ABC transporter permease [Desulfarculaceae bacterium]MCF8045961.1 branched-chain amino acid ABC transporter permease [Desulfarculaceae bacterium]MCF8063690.1 branched-chain amino acid ABC transporter permease [Desulfarculaceae bacterium]MCF8097595.1 branched-chain amino acid ABC transporter permease [Desulfarculaceae bacterium]MCF8121164.1 branched-chain amino acid ABC transporter permease [Desulfarculaceae bacterium]